jgi:hypothetical protein
MTSLLKSTVSTAKSLRKPEADWTAIDAALKYSILLKNFYEPDDEVKLLWVSRRLRKNSELEELESRDVKAFNSRLIQRVRIHVTRFVFKGFIEHDKESNKLQKKEAFKKLWKQRWDYLQPIKAVKTAASAFTSSEIHGARLPDTISTRNSAPHTAIIATSKVIPCAFISYPSHAETNMRCRFPIVQSLAVESLKTQTSVLPRRKDTSQIWP